MSKLWNWYRTKILKDVWVVRACYFPYSEGYATYNKWRNTILDTEIETREQAQRICDHLNKYGV